MASRRVIVLILLTVLVVPTGAHARAVMVPAGDTSATRDLMAILDRAFPNERSYGDARAHLEAEKRLLEVVNGTEAYLSPQSAESGEARDVDNIPIPVGDLSHDGRDDVLVKSLVHDAFNPDVIVEERLTAVRGNTGAILWSDATFAPNNTIIQPVVDVNGDSAPDILVVEYLAPTFSESNYICLPNTNDCAGYEDGATWNWKISVISGSSGARFLPMTVPGNGSTVDGWVYHAAGEDQVHIMHAPGAAVVVSVSGDHDNDDARELVVNSIGIDDVFGFVRGEAISTLGGGVHVEATPFVDIKLTQTDALVVSGADGTTLHTEAAGRHVGEPALLLPVPDLVGDRREDLLWQVQQGTPAVLGSVILENATICSEFPQDPIPPDIEYASPKRVDWPGCYNYPYEEESTLDFTVLNGSHDQNFAVAYSQNLQNLDIARAFLEPLKQDFDGDGRSDLRINGFIQGQIWQQGIVSGNTGTYRWHRTTYAYWTPISGASTSGADFAAVNCWNEGATLEISFHEFNGADGEELAEPRGAEFDIQGDPDGTGCENPVSLGDVNGDSVDDVMIHAYANGGFNEVVVFSGVPSEGRLFDWDVCCGGVLALAAGDTSGDDLGDLYLSHYVQTGLGLAVRVMTYSFATSPVLTWQYDYFDAPPPTTFDVVAGGRVNGSNNWVFVQHATFDPVENSQIAAIDGSDGAVAWLFGDS